MRRIGILIFFMCLLATLSWGQDIQYSQYYANPIYLNPALAGSTGATRIGVNFRNQWPALDQTFLAYTAYLDHYEERYNSGFAVILQGATESFTQTNWNELGLTYSYRIQLSETSFVQAGVQGSFISRDASFGRVVFGSQLDIDRGLVDLSAVGIEGESLARAVDAHAGLVYYGKNAWLGASVAHLLQPNLSYLIDGSSQLPRRIGVHGGYRFSLRPGDINDFVNNRDQERSFSVGFNYKQQGQYSQLDLGTEFFFDPLALGLWYRGLPTKYGLPNHESLVAVLGVSLDSGMDVGYSFDFPLSSLNLGRSGGSHELTVKFVVFSRNQGRGSYGPLPSFRY